MDFGTTNSGIAVYRTGDLHILPLDPIARTATMRSVIYLTREHQAHFGGNAIQLYNQQNMNRERRMVQRRVGRIEMYLGELGRVATDVHVMVDELEPGRLLKSLKSALATDYIGTSLFGREYRLEDLIALYLSQARQRAEELTGEVVDSVVLGRPVHFVDALTEADDARAESRLRESAYLAGFKTIEFEFEPIAAALSYARRVTHPQHILVYDFGGGTLDVTVMKVAPNRSPDILAIGGVGIAGDRFDQRIVEHALTPHFGRDVTWGDKNLPLPRTLIDQITAWDGLAALATSDTRTYLHKLQSKCSAPARLYALESLIFNFYGFALFEAVEISKRELSDQPFTLYRFTGEDLDIWQPLTRSQFEQHTAPEWKQIRGVLQDVIARSGLDVEQIDAVVRTGGSSSIPISLRLLTDLFGAEKLVTEDLFTGVTAGLGLRAGL
jgi:hypothetical chaperone protein